MRATSRSLGAGQVGVVTPATIFGSNLSTWLRADNAGTVDGTAVPSWTDKSVNANVYSQSTGAQQPTYHSGVSANAINGCPVVSFNAASSQILKKVSPVGFPATGGIGMFIVMRWPAAQSAFVQIFEYASNSSTLGCGLGIQNANSPWILYYQAGATKTKAANTTMPTNTPVLFNGHIDAGGVGHVGLWMRATADTITGWSFTGGFSACSVGGQGSSNTNYVTADIAEIVITNGAPTPYQWTQLSRYFSDRYNLETGSGYNASALTISTYDGSGDIAEVSILDFHTLTGGTWNGFRYWMATSPFHSSSAVFENPSIRASNDGTTWTLPVGCPDPVVAYPGGGNAGNNADAGLFWNPNDNKLYMTYNIENATPVSNGGIFVVSSSDGVTWSAPTHIVSWTVNHQFGDAELTYYNGTYYLTGGYSASATFPWEFGIYTANSVLGPYTFQQSVTLSFARKDGHAPSGVNNVSQPFFIGNRWVLANGDFGNNGVLAPDGQIWLCSSPDLVHWNVAGHPLLVTGFDGTADNTSIYRCAVWPNVDGINLDVWYTGTYNGAWRVFKTTVPLSEIP